MLLLDTHVLLWLMTGERFGAESARRIDAAGEAFVSAISFWEVALLHRKGRLRLDDEPAGWRERALDRGIREISLSGPAAVRSALLPDLHDDPADRWILATALENDAFLITADTRLLSWPGDLKRQDARQ